jgi:AmmeMemoRadiSam system protein A
MPFTSLTKVQQTLLLQLARKAIEQGTQTGERLTEAAIDRHIKQWISETGDATEEILSNLTTKACSFVTLHTKQGKLRGCIGTLQAYQPLIYDVAEHAVEAALKDFRFPNVQPEEVAQLSIEISILTPQIELDVKDEQDLLTQLTPNQDGITIEEGYHKATFLPSVWSQIATKQEFLNHLKEKAGLPTDYWSPSLKVFRYQALSMSED